MTKRARRSWTQEQKATILRDAEIHGVARAARMHDISPNLLSKWRSQAKTGELAPPLSANTSASNDQVTTPLPAKLASKADVTTGQLSAQRSGSPDTRKMYTLRAFSACDMATDHPAKRKQINTISEPQSAPRTKDARELGAVRPFHISPEDANGSPKPAKKKPVTTGNRATNLQVMSDDAVWVLEQDISRMKAEMEVRRTPMTDRERHGFVKVTEQLRKMRMAELEVQKHHDPGKMDDDKLAEELTTILLEQDVATPVVEKVLTALGLFEESND